jgi:hypothetical protein
MIAWPVRRHNIISTVLAKFKDLIGITVAQVVKENATQAPSFPTVLDEEVVVCPLFKFGIEFWIVTIAHFLVRAMDSSM